MKSHLDHLNIAEARRAFTLVEVLVSIIILSLALTGSFSLMNWVTTSTAFSSQTTTATSLAYDKLEEMLNDTYATLASGSDAPGLFSRTWTVTDVVTHKTVSVDVTWTAPENGATRQVVVNSIIAEP